MGGGAMGGGAMEGGRNGRGCNGNTLIRFEYSCENKVIERVWIRILGLGLLTRLYLSSTQICTPEYKGILLRQVPNCGIALGWLYLGGFWLAAEFGWVWRIWVHLYGFGF